MKKPKTGTYPTVIKVKGCANCAYDPIRKEYGDDAIICVLCLEAKEPVYWKKPENEYLM